MNKFILALSAVLLFTSVSSHAGPVPHPSTYAEYEQTYMNEKEVQKYWYGLALDKSYVSGLLAHDVYGLIYVKDVEEDNSDSYGMVMVNQGILDPLPSDWEIIFYVNYNGDPLSVFAINHNNGMSSIFLPGVLTAD